MAMQWNYIYYMDIYAQMFVFLISVYHGVSSMTRDIHEWTIQYIAIYRAYCAFQTAMANKGGVTKFAHHISLTLLVSE